MPVFSDRYEAVLFDMDGVVTDTASIRASCWKITFDEYHEKRAEGNSETFRPFDIDTDYKLYVDEKPRYHGVRDFLESRGIVLACGSPDIVVRDLAELLPRASESLSHDLIR
jgi:beta-phosphoglucomutase-like phosphatase (HAD superfamily)